MLKCNQINATTRRRCASEFRRPWNLRRHCAMVHQLQVTPLHNSIDRQDTEQAESYALFVLPSE